MNKLEELTTIQAELRTLGPRLRKAGAPRAYAKQQELMRSLEAAIRYAKQQEETTDDIR